ncbi:hypothetical protein [Sporosarcina aquimarina]|uniref:DUF3139 domain-containing protein n=1 Tax=Sporosarcina aquimarina TaxID=114975 RepID=A0ABU4FZB8_9BACL|nr:hypothetical protein [Sporosarcina aquimarina]MDW0110054.1 hypothetical protein [Sporosarcina aquimarina]
MNKNILIYILIISLIAMFIYFNYENYKVGEVEEREELLVATTFDLVENQNIKMEDIENIKVYRLNTGVYPFFYNIVVVLKNGKEFYYEWADKDKKKLNIK